VCGLLNEPGESIVELFEIAEETDHCNSKGLSSQVRFE